MTSIYFVLGLVSLVAVSIWIAVHMARSSGRLEESERNLKGDVNAIRKFAEALSSSKKGGEQLVASLRNRARDGMRDKG